MTDACRLLSSEDGQVIGERMTNMQRTHSMGQLTVLAEWLHGREGVVCGM